MPDERIRAVRELSQLGPVARPAIEPLIESLADPDARVRRTAPEALGSILRGDSADPHAAAVRNALTASLGDRDTGARRAAAIELARFSNSPRSSSPR